MNEKERAWRQAGMESGPAAFRTTADPLSFPQTLAGTWPPPAGGDSKYDQLYHVAALDAVAMALTTEDQLGAAKARSRASASGMDLDSERPDSQGRMDLITMLPGKLKEIVNTAMAAMRPPTGVLTRPKT